MKPLHKNKNFVNTGYLMGTCALAGILSGTPSIGTPNLQSGTTSPFQKAQEATVDWTENANRLAMVQQSGKNREAISLLQSWLSQEQEEDGDETWDEIKKSLNEHRLSERLIFPQET